jgi:UrcA family protein
MNTEMKLSRRCGWKAAARTAALIALSTIPPLAAIADERLPPVLETRAVKVSLADLELSTPEGMHVAYERLHQVARQLCLGFKGIRNIAHQPKTFVRYVDEAVADALQQVKGPTLAAGEKASKEL